VDLRETAGESRFRAELRSWLSARLPTDPTGTPGGGWDRDATRSFLAALFQAGYAGLTWPVEYGGGGRPVAYQAIFLEETALAGADEHAGVIGLGMVGPTLLADGTPEQRSRYLPRILSGEVLFCQGFSEPDAGSDLAAVRTRADVDSDHLVITGRKTWSTYGALADHCLLLARTGAADGRNRGLTCVLLDLSRPGVRVRPERQLSGVAQFGEIELDGVRVPRAQVVGEIGDGWRVAMGTLAHERGTFGVTLTARLERQFRRLLHTARHTEGADPVLRDRIAALHVEVSALRWTAQRMLSESARDGVPGPECSVLKLRWSQCNQRLTALALELLVADAPLADSGFWNGYWQHQQLRSRANTIEGGTSQIVRDVIATRVLGLPRTR
jgi:alkylation response protein AidB-like acyl-CoA dehydrogenase